MISSPNSWICHFLIPGVSSRSVTSFGFRVAISLARALLHISAESILRLSDRDCRQDLSILTLSGTRAFSGRLLFREYTGRSSGGIFDARFIDPIRPSPYMLICFGLNSPVAANWSLLDGLRIAIFINDAFLNILYKG